ncbi:MAG: tRNA lysidine(34) synthetase TilS [Desulfobacteraceae bacterium]|nr:tRNA lysidine(34) synthetase TilS [Desulfobacteraceae bacterium]
MEAIKKTIKKTRSTISRYDMINPGDLLVVAVSGGPDSVSLLDILHGLMDDLKIKLVVAHYNHGLRQAEDGSETQFARHLATSMNLPFQTEKASLSIEGSTASLEEKARYARYEFLEKVRDRYHAQKIAVGHNLNDQAETILMRLLRGSGPSGLSGIPPCRDNTIIRPLLEIKRVEIESYLKARGLSYVTDSSNLETRYLRNKIRLELMPLLLEYQPRLIEHMGQLAFILRGENEYLELQAEGWVSREAELNRNGDIFIPISSFITLPRPVRNRVTRHLCKKKKSLRRIDHGHIQSVYKLARGNKPQGVLNLPNGLTVKKIYDRLAFTSGMEQESIDFHYLLDRPGTFYLDRIGRSISLVEMEGEPNLSLGTHRLTGYLDADKLQYPLVVRNFRPGDRFVPLGMAGHKKIKDFFMDLKISSDMRALTPILLSKETPVWVCGQRIDDRFKVTSETIKVLKVTIA